MCVYMGKVGTGVVHRGGLSIFALAIQCAIVEDMYQIIGPGEKNERYTVMHPVLHYLLFISSSLLFSPGRSRIM